MYPANGENPDALLQFADAAMYQAKKNGRDIYCYFAPELTRRHNAGEDLIRICIKHANEESLSSITSRSFQQMSGRITGVEALLRWYHPEEGLISRTSSFHSWKNWD